MDTLVDAEIWRDGGSLSMVVRRSDGSAMSFWLQVDWSLGCTEKSYQNLSVSKSNDPLTREEKIEVGSGREDELLKQLMLTDISSATDGQRHRFAAFVQILRERHRPKEGWSHAPVHADLLTLRRFNGQEFYPVAKAEWNLYQDEETGLANLWINLNADFAVSQQEDTYILNGQPKWELNWIEETLSASDLVPGFERHIPSGYVGRQEAVRLTNFYYTSHEETDDNWIQIREVEDDKLKILLHGVTLDVSSCDEAKPKTKIAIETWFTRNPAGSKTIS